MKYIKTYEEKRRYLKIGDWVICTDFFRTGKGGNEFIENHIGRLNNKDINDSQVANFPYYVVYDDDPEGYRFLFDRVDKNKWGRYFGRKEILHFSKDREDLEIILTAKKYDI